MIDTEKACVKRETLILIIDKVSGPADMIEHRLSFEICVPHIAHNIDDFASNCYSWTIANDWLFQCYCCDANYPN